MTINDKVNSTTESDEYLAAMVTLNQAKDKIIKETAILSFKVKTAKENTNTK